MSNVLIPSAEEIRSDTRVLCAHLTALAETVIDIAFGNATSAEAIKDGVRADARRNRAEFAIEDLRSAFVEALTGKPQGQYVSTTTFAKALTARLEQNDAEAKRRMLAVEPPPASFPDAYQGGFISPAAA